MVRRGRQPIDTFVVVATLKTIKLPNRFFAADLQAELSGMHPRAALEALRILLTEVRDAGSDRGAHKRFLPLFSNIVQGPSSDGSMTTVKSHACCYASST